MIHFDRQQSTRKSENAWSPQPASPTRAVKTLAQEELASGERLDSDHDMSSITWYPFDWRTGGPNPTYSPLRKSSIHTLPPYFFVYNLSLCRASILATSTTAKIPFMDFSIHPIAPILSLRL